MRPGVSKGLMYIPERACCPEASELQFRGATTFGDIPSIDAGEEHRYTLDARPLQGGKTMRDLCKARTETRRHQFDVVTELFRHRQKLLVGQRQRPGEIVAQPILQISPAG